MMASSALTVAGHCRDVSSSEWHGGIVVVVVVVVVSPSSAHPVPLFQAEDKIGHKHFCAWNDLNYAHNYSV